MPTSSTTASSPRTRRLADYGFFAALALAALLFYRTVQAVMVPVVLGAFAAVLAAPAYRGVRVRVGYRTRLAATLTTISVLVLVLLPSCLLGWALVQELTHAATWLAAAFADGGVGGILHRLPIPTRLRRALEPELQALVNTLVVRLGDFVTSLVTRASNLFVGGFLFVLSLYYFLVDGARWLREIERMAPIEPRYVRAFADEFDAVSHALFFGSVMTALVQGAVATAGYVIFGVPQPILWGTATALMSLTPMIGTAIVWVPIAIVLAWTGEPARALGLAAWGAVLTGSIDNIARPLLMKGRMRLHPFLVFLAIIGGVAAFGVVGILIGPLAAALFLTALRIYDRDYRERLLRGAGSSSSAKPA